MSQKDKRYTHYEIVERLWDKTLFLGSCWVYKGYKKQYGELRLGNGVREMPHRLSAMIFLDYNRDRKDIQVNHKEICCYKGCWNPEHIYVGTQIENMADVVKADKHFYLSRTHCKNGHLLVEENVKVVTEFKGNRRRVCKLCLKEWQKTASKNYLNKKKLEGQKEQNI
jgi:hypothetical protein